MTVIEYNNEAPKRSVFKALLKGARFACPACGKGKLYAKYLKSADSCNACGEELHHHQADDAPPYFTMLIIGHIVFPAIFVIERFYQPELWVHFMIWVPILLGLCLALLPIVKGAIIGVQWALRMHGFDETSVDNLESENGDH